MRKAVVTRMWLAGLIALALGLLMIAISVAMMLAFGGTFQAPAAGGSYDFVPTMGGPFWTSIGGIVVGAVIAAVGSLIQLVAWIGALMNTFALTDKTWFVVMLVGGLLGFAVGVAGFAAMVAYVIAGPDGLALKPTIPPAPSTRPAVLAPTS